MIKKKNSAVLYESQELFVQGCRTVVNMANVLKLSAPLREIRIHLCQKSDTSKGVRDFIHQQYVALKQQNPKVPILIRECSGIQPRIWARYDGGKESSQSLASLQANQVLEKLRFLAQKS